jgi:hypothetical protein
MGRHKLQTRAAPALFAGTQFEAQLHRNDAQLVTMFGLGGSLVQWDPRPMSLILDIPGREAGA